MYASQARDSLEFDGEGPMCLQVCEREWIEICTNLGAARSAAGGVRSFLAQRGHDALIVQIGIDCALLIVPAVVCIVRRVERA